ncbi:hypothetical protein J2T31_002611 [Kerstersia gyiorum]|nr:hypothetical protein [Kerstersia gyiorum]MCP1824372.1 hypothetical protein [Kerstersia gyiorum]MCP1827678.1 hypothetical protein [Kerstersia gyiorum]MCW2451446.1 hypothetical protein [Kerstersia gyiorum]
MQAQDGVAEVPFHMIVRTQEGVAGNDAQRARHAEMHDLHTVVEAQQQVFATAAAFQQRMPWQNGGQFGGNGPSQPWFSYNEFP